MSVLAMVMDTCNFFAPNCLRFRVVDENFIADSEAANRYFFVGVLVGDEAHDLALCMPTNR